MAWETTTRVLPCAGLDLTKNGADRHASKIGMVACMSCSMNEWHEIKMNIVSMNEWR